MRQNVPFICFTATRIFLNSVLCKVPDQTTPKLPKINFYSKLNSLLWTVRKIWNERGRENRCADKERERERKRKKEKEREKRDR